MSKARALVVTGIILLICALVLAGCGGGGQSQAVGSLDGYVYVTTSNARSIGVRGLQEDILDQTSKPLAGATVSIGGKTGTTDSDGYFTITSIPVGTYTVFISASSYQTLSIEGVTISKDQTTHLSYQNISFSRKAWNFLVYLDGDNNLEEYAIADLNEMERVGSTDQVNVLVLIDRAPGHDNSNADWTTTRLYYVTKDTNTSIPSTIRSTLLAALGERDMSDPATLRDFIVYCQEHFPADRTCLTLWNHGGGVYPKSAGTAEKRSTGSNSKTELKGGLRGICWDDTTTSQNYPWNCLTTDEVAWALSEARDQTGQKIDVINMDACLTQMLEVAYELWNSRDRLTDYLVGSEEIVPGNGNNYVAVLNHLTGNPNMDARTLATTLVDDYYDYYKSTAENTTYSAISLGAEFDSLASAFASFATAMKNSSDIESIWRASFEAEFSSYENKDLYTYADRVSYYTADPAIDSAAANLKTAIGNAVVAHKETGYYAGYAHGISILLPDAFAWPSYSGMDQYPTLALSRNTNWDEFIGTFVALTENYVGSEDSLSASITWSSGDCDLCVYEAKYHRLYFVGDGSSPNGVFSQNCTNGGTESWTLEQPHDVGYYAFLVLSYNYTGDLQYSITKNGVPSTGTISVQPGYMYILSLEWAKNHPGFKVTKIALGSKKAKK